MSESRRSSFDRVRPRSPDAVSPVTPIRGTGADGRRALFSTSDPQPAPGSFVLECSSCRQRSVLLVMQAVRAALPSLHLPLIKRGHPSWMRCPACGRRTWVRISLKL